MQVITEVTIQYFMQHFFFFSHKHKNTWWRDEVLTYILFSSGLFLFTLQKEKKKHEEELEEPLGYSVCSNMAAFFFKEICD